MTGYHGGDHSDCAVCEAARKHPASGDHQFTPKLRVAQ